MKLILIFFILINYLNAMNCSDYKDFQLFNGHYYSVSIDKLTFDAAKQIAINNGGYLAIPNSQAENDFIKTLIGGGSTGWIGIYDPNNLQNFCYGNNCAYDSSRFKDIKNNSLLYKNFYVNEPDNLVKSYDVVDGKQMVSPLGEHWVGINGNNGKWYDFGNHADEYNNPVKYKAVFEFDSLNECKPLTDDGVQDLTGRFCNTKIWDANIDTITMGQTLNCQLDSKGNEYCPSALSQCGQNWDYENGYSTSGIGQVIDYTNKVSITVSTPAISVLKYSSGYLSYGMQQWTNWQDVGANGISIMNNWTNYEGMFMSGSSVNIRVFNNQLQYLSGVNWLNTSSIFLLNYFSGYEINCAMIYARGIDISYNSLLNEQILLTSIYVHDGACGLTSSSNIKLKIFQTCSNGTTPINGQCTTTTTQCPTGTTETTGTETANGQCKRTQEYTYYNYLCNNAPNVQGYNFTPTTTGGNTGKTDPNNTIQNDLTSPLNGSTPPTNNCKRQKFTCQANADRPCSYVNNQWQCSPFPCLGQSNLESLDTQVGASDKNNNGWSDDGNCTGTIYIFNGKSNKCRSWDMFFGLTGGGCCDKDKVAAGLIACKENEKMLAKKREQKQTHYIGNFCSKELKLGFTKICVQKSDSYCTYNSSLGRIIQEQGRNQLSISWGEPKNPECRGFTPEEFQKIDFSKIDLTEFVKDIQSSVQTNVIQNLGTYVKDKVGDFYGN